MARSLTWLRVILASGAVPVIPEIAHYEVRRELHRIPTAGSLRRLDYPLDLGSGLDHLVLTTDATLKAADFWSFLRQSEIPTRTARRS